MKGKTLRRALAFMSALMVSGCGIPGPGGPGSGYSVSINSWNISSTNLNPADSFTVQWSVSFNAPLYRAEAFITPTNTQSPDSQYQLFGLNCGGSFSPCGTSGSISCTYVERTSTDLRFTCGTDNVTIPVTGTNLYIVFRACVYEGLDYKCDTRVRPITVN